MDCVYSLVPDSITTDYMSAKIVTELLSPVGAYLRRCYFKAFQLYIGKTVVILGTRRVALRLSCLKNCVAQRLRQLLDSDWEQQEDFPFLTEFSG